MKNTALLGASKDESRDEESGHPERGENISWHPSKELPRLFMKPKLSTGRTEGGTCEGKGTKSSY